MPIAQRFFRRDSSPATLGMLSHDPLTLATAAPDGNNVCVADRKRADDRSPMVLDIRKLDIYRKVPKDLTQPTLAGAIISITCVLFISFMVFNDILEYIYIDM
ncbi:hypothetical protein ANCCAN_00193 [Ancylostoma caninum]|uniref:Endoplasmic reticulum vesicle transporter N-terminal domain-containing protein n=1 Tax=Ancylostoma caninum TaxID=29170 RepID=A0A368HDJ1_ANCCA|nr:hypothetical protein ANCCAN_00193 [Ancylostoma caninum]